MNRHTVILWRQRFLQEGKESLWEVAPGRGRKPTYGPEKIQAIVKATLQSKPKGMTQWSCRLMAENQGLSKSTVSNIWRSHNLKPQRVKTLKLSCNPQFLEKLTDVVGLYLNPPEKAVVLCVDEKSQIQALDRTQPGLPMKKRSLRHELLPAVWSVTANADSQTVSLLAGTTGTTESQTQRKLSQVLSSGILGNLEIHLGVYGVDAGEVSSALVEGTKERGGRCVVAEGLAEVGEAVNISWCEDEAATELKGINAKFVLMMAGGAGAVAALEIVAAKDVQQIRGAQVGDAIRLATFIDKQGKLDSRFFAENAGIV